MLFLRGQTLRAEAHIELHYHAYILRAGKLVIIKVKRTLMPAPGLPAIHAPGACCSEAMKPLANSKPCMLVDPACTIQQRRRNMTRFIGSLSDSKIAASDARATHSYVHGATPCTVLRASLDCDQRAFCFLVAWRAQLAWRALPPRFPCAAFPEYLSSAPALMDLGFV